MKTAMEICLNLRLYPWFCCVRAIESRSAAGRKSAFRIGSWIEMMLAFPYGVKAP